MAEGVGFEPTSPITQAKRLAGARTRPLCDPSHSQSHCIKVRLLRQAAIDLAPQLGLASD